MRNTLRFVYDVEGSDWELYPPMVEMGLPSGERGLGYTDLSMCRLRGSSYVHLKYLQNMGVTSTSKCTLSRISYFLDLLQHVFTHFVEMLDD